MVKLAFHPAREEMRRLRARWDLEDAEEIALKPYDTTLTNGLDDTLQHLRVIREDTHSSVEADKLRTQAIDQLTALVHKQGTELASIVTTLNRKASKGQLHKSLELISTKLEKRVDNIFRLIAVLGVVFGILVAIKGH